MSEMPLQENESLEDLLMGKLRIIQPIKGYRFSIDSVLLAGFARIKQRDRIADLGTGSGVIPLILAQRYPHTSITGFEIDEAAADRARRSVVLNRLENRIAIISGDLRISTDLPDMSSFNAVVANPPYGKASAGKVSTGEEKGAARHELAGGLDDFIAAAALLLKSKGRLSLVYPARRLTDVMDGMRRRGIEPKRLRTVHSRVGGPAKLVLVEGVKGGGVEMEVMPPFYIYDEEGSYTAETAAMYGGG